MYFANLSNAHSLAPTLKFSEFVVEYDILWFLGHSLSREYLVAFY